MSSFHDSALGDNDASGTTLPTTDGLAVTVGDKVWGIAKWEGDGTETCTMDTGASTPQFSIANANLDGAGGAISSCTFHWTATATGTINPRMVTSVATSFRRIEAISVTPAAGKTLELGAVNAAIGTSSTPSAGAASATAAGVSFTGFGLFGSRTLTPGSGWTEPAEFNPSRPIHSEYQLQSGAGSLTGNGTLDSSIEWTAQLAIFNEVASGSAPKPRPRFPNKGPLPRNYGARRLGFTQGIAVGANLALAIDTAGSITVAGQSVTFGLGLALSTQGSITIQGQSVTPALGLALSAGSITIQGQATTFGLGLALSTQGSITIAGQSITLDNGITLAISTPGSITLQGQSVTFNLGTAVGVGSITLQGQSTGLSLGAALSPGSVTIQGQSLTTGFGLALSAGSITIDGQSVALDLAGALTLAIDVAGSISIDGQIVDLVNSSPAETQTYGPMGPRETVRSMFHASHRPQRKRKDEPAEIVQIPNMAEEPADKLPQTPQVVEPFTTPLADLIGLDLRVRLTEKRLELIRQQRSDEEAVLVLMLMMDDD